MKPKLLPAVLALLLLTSCGRAEPAGDAGSGAASNGDVQSAAPSSAAEQSTTVEPGPAQTEAAPAPVDAAEPPEPAGEGNFSDLNGVWYSEAGDTLVLEDGGFRLYDPVSVEGITVLREGCLLSGDEGVTLIETDRSGAGKDRACGTLFFAEPEALRLTLEERGEVVFIRAEPPETVRAAELAGSYVSVTGRLLVLEGNAFYQYDDVNKDDTVREGSLAEAPGRLDMTLSGRGDACGAVVPTAPGVVTVAVPPEGLPVVYVQTDAPAAPALTGDWEPDRVTLAAEDAPALFRFTEDGSWTALDEDEAGTFAPRQSGPWTAGRWTEEAGGEDYRAFSLFPEEGDEALTGAELYFDNDGRLLLYFYNGTVYQKSS